MKATATKKKTTKTIKYSNTYKPDKVSFEEWQIALRRQFALEQKFIVKNIGGHKLFSDFSVQNPQSEKTYKVAIRSKNIGLNFCNCPDFKGNNLGTCKHIEYVFNYLSKQKGFTKILELGYQQTYSSVSLKYGFKRKIAVRLGTAVNKEIEKLVSTYFDGNGILKEDAYETFDKFLEKIQKLDADFRCYPDALDFIITERENRRRQKLVSNYFTKGHESKELDALIKAKLFPYQKESVLAAASAGRYIIADDMGLGKTIQSIAIAELMKKLFGIQSVLIVCPTSLKYQWKTEIEKFTNNAVAVIEGLFDKRADQYKEQAFYKIVSYHAAVKDIESINGAGPDLIILDEAQRIKNWKTKTAQAIKKLQSQYSLVLTGTPLENKLEELHSLVEFVDKYKLGLLSKFLYDHQIIEENTGKVIGYKDLHTIGKSISSICIRRTKKEVLKQLPERIDKILMVGVTNEQATIHEEYYEIVCRLVNKWRRCKFLNEADRQRLLLGLNCMRMVSNSTYILDQQTRHDTKVDELMVILDEVLQNKEEKIVVFSQWERMTRLVSWELEKRKVKFEYLHGGVPSADRKDLLDNFRNDPESKVFLSTDAGGVGLNLQSASVLVNLDCPWNPAVLEQRIARIHRLGQQKPVTIINLIAKGTIEERLLELISFKKKLFEGVLDGGESTVFMGESKMKQFMETVDKLTSATAPITNTENETQEYAELQDQKEISVAENQADYVSEYKPQLLAQEPSYASVNFKENIESSKIQNDNTPIKNEVAELWKTGASFFDQLTNAISHPEKMQAVISSCMEKDENTGQVNLKIPITDEGAVYKAAAAFTALLQMFKK